MIDNIKDFCNVAKEFGTDVDLATPLNDSTDEEMQKDRELISEFMSYTKETQRLLTICDQSNTQMRNIAQKQIHDNMSAN